MNLKEFSKEYYNLLTTDLEGINLTRILDEDDFYKKQILDSINPYLQSECFQKSLKSKKIRADIGFGGGFPLLVLAKHLPDLEFIGLEARRKKVDAVQYLAAQLNITNVETFHERLEMVLWDQPSCLTFKAVGRCKKFLSMIQVASEVDVYFYKGPSFEEEEEKEVSLLSDWKLIEKRLISVPDTEKRWLIGFSKSKNRVPRGTKGLVKVSELIEECF
ncbi:MAG: class I SAM-dependent methyltransferase [Halobacteriovoraceae bacterium]|nr:class I SAM-dependent methyltransferase [Halobacteriovoraceae bacterium]